VKTCFVLLLAPLSYQKVCIVSKYCNESNDTVCFVHFRPSLYKYLQGSLKSTSRFKTKVFDKERNRGSSTY